MSSCQFQPEGNTKESCFNKCQEVNAGDCSSYCTNVCNECTDSVVCKWLNTNNQSEIDMLKANYQELTNKIKQYQQKEKTIWDSNSNISDEEYARVQIHLLDQITDLKRKRQIIWNYLVNEYNLNTQLTDANNKVVNRSNKLIKNQKTQLRKSKEALDSLRNLNSTKRRQIEINVYKYNKTKNETRLMVWTIIFLCSLFIFILLHKFGILTKMGIVVFYTILVLMWGLFAFYWLKIKDNNRDDQFWSEFNYTKPNKDSVSTNAIQEMSSADKQKCLALSDMIKSEDYNPTDVDIGDVQRFVNDPNKCKRPTK